MTSIIVWPDTGDNIMGMPEQVNEKKNKTGNGSNGVVSMMMTRKDTDAHRVL